MRSNLHSRLAKLEATDCEDLLIVPIFPGETEDQALAAFNGSANVSHRTLVVFLNYFTETRETYQG